MSTGNEYNQVVITEVQVNGQLQRYRYKVSTGNEYNQVVWE